MKGVQQVKTVNLSTKLSNGSRNCRPLNARGMNLDSLLIKMKN